MLKLITNALIGGRVVLAGETISAEDAKGVRPEVFDPETISAEDVPKPSGRRKQQN